MDDVKAFTTAAKWRDWLAKNHATSDGVFLKIPKKVPGKKAVDYQRILDEALCFGWIDAIRKSHDENHYLQRFTPRRPKSIWSKRNREHVARLIESGQMTPSGLAEIERAKQDGRWDNAYDAQSEMQIPEDFLAALNKNKKAAKFFATLNRTNHFAVTFRLQNAKRPETRANRIAQFVERFANGEKLV